VSTPASQRWNRRLDHIKEAQLRHRARALWAWQLRLGQKASNEFLPQKARCTGNHDFHAKASA
jgi:hypothetical protein